MADGPPRRILTRDEEIALLLDRTDDGTRRREAYFLGWTPEELEDLKRVYDKYMAYLGADDDAVAANAFIAGLRYWHEVTYDRPSAKTTVDDV